MYWLVLSGAYTEPGMFQLLTLPCQQGAGVWKEPGGNAARTADPDCPKGCPVPGGVLLNYKTGGAGRGSWHCSGTGWVTVSGWWATALSVIHFVYLYYFPFIFCPIKLSLSQATSITFFFSWFSSLFHEGWVKLDAAELPARLNHNNIMFLVFFLIAPPVFKCHSSWPKLFKIFWSKRNALQQSLHKIR